MSVAYFQDQSKFVADRVFQNIPSPNQSDVYYTYDRGMFNRNQMAKRAPRTEANGIGYTVDNTPNFFCDVFGLHHDIPDQVRANADAVLKPDREAVELLTHQALIKREVDFMANFFATSKWGTDVTGVAGAPGAGEFKQWDQADSDPIGDVEKGKRTTGLTGYEGNILVVDRITWGFLKHHPDILDKIKFGQTPGSPAIATLQAVAAILEVEEILVSAAVQNTAKEGATNVDAFIAGKNALLAYRPPSPGIMTPAAGYTFSWNGYLGASDQGIRFKRFRMEE